MKSTEHDATKASFLMAFQAANSADTVIPSLEYKRGWWWFDGNRYNLVRTAELQKMTTRLEERAKEMIDARV